MEYEYLEDLVTFDFSAPCAAGRTFCSVCRQAVCHACCPDHAASQHGVVGGARHTIDVSRPLMIILGNLSGPCNNAGILEVRVELFLGNRYDSCAGGTSGRTLPSGHRAGGADRGFRLRLDWDSAIRPSRHQLRRVGETAAELESGSAQGKLHCL